MVKIRVGGVPEHFNLPWHFAKEEGFFEELGIDFEWLDFPGGTGAMNQALRSREIDLAIILTEGILADITKGNPSCILQTYVQSPLVWGIHTAATSVKRHVIEFENPVYAISRYGSGSHLMAILHAEQAGVLQESMKFQVVGSLEGALQAFEENQVDLFFWEKETTKAYCDENRLQCIDTFPTPWPCFQLACVRSWYQKNKVVLDLAISKVFEIARDMEQRAGIFESLHSRYALKVDQSKSWFGQVLWGNGKRLSSGELVKIGKRLSRLGIIEKSFSFEDASEMLID